MAFSNRGCAVSSQDKVCFCHPYDIDVGVVPACCPLHYRAPHFFASKTMLRRPDCRTIIAPAREASWPCRNHMRQQLTRGADREPEHAGQH